VNTSEAANQMPPAHVAPATTVYMLQALTAAQANLLRNLNPRLLLEALFLEWPEV